MILAPVPPGWAIARIFTSALCRSYNRKYGEKETFGCISLLPALEQKRGQFCFEMALERLWVLKIFFVFVFSLCMYVCVCVWFLLNFI